MRNQVKKTAAAFFGALLLAVFCGVAPVTAMAAEKPEVAAQGAALYNATTGEFLYGKNENKQFYPASITKVMTALLVVENAGLEDVVTFTDSATKNLESGAVSLDVTTGDKIPVRDCLYGLLLKSANEVANGLAEHVAGSVPAFADMMNARAKALGCTATNFVNPNGLNNASHLTTPHDMALITAACFNNAAFREIEKSTTYHFPATLNRPDGTNITMGHKMISTKNSQHYDGILGGKTGYTSKAGNTLVTCAERNGVRMVAVVMKCAGTHYSDTKKLLDYGFAEAGTGNAVQAVPVQETGSSQAAGETLQAAETLAGPGAALGTTASETAASETAASETAAVVMPSVPADPAGPEAATAQSIQETETQQETSAAETGAAAPAAETPAGPGANSGENESRAGGAVVGTAPGGEQN